MKEEEIRKGYESKTDLENQIEELEDRIIDIKQNLEIESRWQNLIGFGCGYFNDWQLKDNIMIIKYTNRCGDINEDHIPIQFFTREGESALREYKKYLKTIQEKQEEKRKQAKIKEAKKILKQYAE